MDDGGIAGRTTHKPMGSLSPTPTSGVHHRCGAVGTARPPRTRGVTTPLHGVRQGRHARSAAALSHDTAIRGDARDG